MSNTFVVLVGLGVVFAGLICIILVCMMMSAVVRSLVKSKPENKPAAPTVGVPSAASNTIADRDRIVVAISAAIAEEIGEEAGAIRIVSLKKI